jgi:hypothetical protein
MNIALNQVRIASPCTAPWEDMVGDDRSRLCGQCNLNVYNIVAMSQSEAERLIAEKEGRLCLRLHQRMDGTVITRDCPIGLAAIRRKSVWLLGKIAAGFAITLSGIAWATDITNPYRERVALTGAAPISTLARWMREPPRQVMITAGMMLPPPAPAPSESTSSSQSPPNPN